MPATVPRSLLLSRAWPAPTHVYVAGMARSYACVCRGHGPLLRMCMSRAWPAPTGGHQARHTTGQSGWSSTLPGTTVAWCGFCAAPRRMR